MTESEVLHVFNVHLGTAFLERRHQAPAADRAQTGVLHNEELRAPKIVLGDFNEWTPGLATRLLGSHLKSVDIRKYLGRAKTYPAIMPVLHLDHIYYDGPLELRELRLHRTARPSWRPTTCRWWRTSSTSASRRRAPCWRCPAASRPQPQLKARGGRAVPRTAPPGGGAPSGSGGGAPAS